MKYWHWDKNNNGSSLSVDQVARGRGHGYKVTSDVPEFLSLGEIEGKSLPSVTTIINSADGSKTEGIRRWSINQTLDYISNNLTVDDVLDKAKGYSEEKFKESGKKGTRIHRTMELYLQDPFNCDKWIGELDAGLDNIHNIFLTLEKIRNFIKSEGLTIVGQELPVFNAEYQYGGSIDLLLSNQKDTIYVCDLKTGSNIYFKDGVQVAAYVACIISMLKNSITPWEGYQDTMPWGDRVMDKLKIGGIVFHLSEDKPDNSTVNWVPEGVIQGTSFISAWNWYNSQKQYKFSSKKLNNLELQ